MSKMAPSPSKCSSTEEIGFEDSFANGKDSLTAAEPPSMLNLTLFFVELFLKPDDEFTGIDFLAELDKDEKMYLEGEFVLHPDPFCVRLRRKTSSAVYF